MNGPTAPEPHEPTDVRYGTRSLLVVTSAVAVVIPLLGAVVRLFPPEAHWRLIAHWGLFFALLSGFVAYVARRRYLAEREAGPMRFRLPTHSYLTPKVPALTRSLVAGCCLLVGPTMWLGTSFLVAQSPHQLWMQLISWQTYVAVFITSFGIANLWWHSSVRICERGFVLRYEFIPWTAARRWYWDSGSPACWCWRSIRKSVSPWTSSRMSAGKWRLFWPRAL